MFTFGVLLIVFSQINIKLIGKNSEADLIFSTMPLILVLIYYIFLFINYKFSLNKL